MTDKFKILLAEDDLNLGVLLVDFLEGEGFDVKLCKDGELALRAFEHDNYNLCLVDVMMPKVDGFAVAKEIRRRDKSIPIIFITARSLKEDKLEGYAIGADDYIIKPFDEEELLWKIRAIVRRVPAREQEAVKPIGIGKYVFDFQNQSLSQGAQVKRITEKECEVLLYLCRNQNKVIKREDLLKDVWGENDYFLGRSLDVFITKIRKYLKDDPGLKIENVFGVGFIFHTQKAGHGEH